MARAATRARRPDRLAGLLPVAAALNTDTPPSGPTAGRVRSLDVSRGLVIALLLASDIAFGPDYGFARHPDWYGLTLYDFIFPGFMLLFGSSLAIAFRDEVRWPRLIRRTAVLLVAGLAFNMATAWNADLGALRLTGVLQLFAVTGLVVIAITRAARRWWLALAVAAVLLVANQLLLLGIGSGCPEGLAQPDCNPSAVVDPAVFGEEHLYHQSERGHDPEGIGVLPGATATVLLGYAAGRLLWTRREQASLPLAGLAVASLAAAPLLAAMLPLNKRLWTPSFALVTAGATIGVLALAVAVFDRVPSAMPATRRPLHVAGWLPEAYGRNSLLMYFGHYVLAAVLANVAFGRTLESWTAGIGAWTYPTLVLGFWTVLALVLHARGRYLTA